MTQAIAERDEARAEAGAMEARIAELGEALDAATTDIKLLTARLEASRDMRAVSDRLALESAAQVERMRECAELLFAISEGQKEIHDDHCPEDDTCSCDNARLINTALSTPTSTALIEFAEKVWKAGVMALRPYTSQSHLDAAWLSSPTYLALTKTDKAKGEQP
jgi:hypothetical protein